jgi:hypothetical protein
MRTSSRGRWTLSVSLTLAVHAAVLAVSFALPCVAPPRSLAAIRVTTVVAETDDERAAPAQPIVLPALAAEELSAVIQPAPAVRDGLPPPTPLLHRRVAEQAPASGTMGGPARPLVAALDEDAPLVVGALSAADATETSSAAVTGAPGDRAPEGRDQVLSTARAAAFEPAAPLRLPGKPVYPRACRQGICRHGQPCEGTSDWKVFVAASGGKPVNIECARAMDCELQNRAIREFFAGAKFPATGRATVYVFPVSMHTTR